MKVKIFRGLSSEKILRDIKRNYGDKAIILSTRSVKENNLNIVEMMVAVEEDEKVIRTEKEQKKQEKQDINVEINLWNRWRSEWQEFKREFFSLFKNHVELNHIPKKYKLLLDYLEKEGVLSEVIFHLYKKISSDPNISVIDLLDFVKKCPDTLNNGKKNKSKIFLFCGPSGVGKSTILLKLALKYKKDNPSKRICIVNGDVFGVKKLFLKYYADLYSIEYREVKDSYEWLKISSERSFFDKIFIDLPALIRKEKLIDWWSSNGLDVFEDSCLYLVLSPTYSFSQIERYIRQYAHKALKGIVWTKLDESEKYGNIINTCFYTHIPIFLFSYGPQLKNSFSYVTNKIVFNLLLKHQLPSD